MINEIFKVLFYPVTILSCFGIILFIKNKLKLGLTIFSIVVFCVLWRHISFFVSSRYYSILFFLGLFFSVYFVNHFFSHFKKKYIQSSIFIVFASALLLLHAEKSFFSFNNKYILDLQEEADNILLREPDNDIWIEEKEFERISHNSWGKTDHLKSLSSDQFYGLTHLFIKNGNFKNSIYLIINNQYPVFYPVADQLPFCFGDDAIRSSKIGHFFSNTKHNKYISIYKHLPYTPTPDFDIYQIYDHAVLKACFPEYEAFIYQNDNKVIWLIGKDIDKRTEVIFQIQSDRPDLLPKSRMQYGFDNLGFRVGDDSELEQIGHYRVVEKSIPKDYPVSFIRVGFSTGDSLLVRSFTPDDY